MNFIWAYLRNMGTCEEMQKEKGHNPEGQVRNTDVPHQGRMKP